MNKGKLVTILSITAISFLFFALVSCTSPSGGNTPVVITWAKWYGGSDWDEAYSIQQTSDGGYIVAGYTESFGAGGDIYILKLKSDGSVDWQKWYGGSGHDAANSIQQTSDGGYIVAGYTDSFGASGDVYILKLDGNGNKVWEKTYGGSDYDDVYSIQQTSDGGYIVAGYTTSFGAGGDIYVLKLKSDGSVDWQKWYGGSGRDGAYFIQQASDGGYIVAGYTESFGAGGRDVYILKLKSDGSVDWQKWYGGGDRDEAWSIQQTSDGGYVVAGFTYSFGAGRSDVYILKLDGNGDKMWAKWYGGSNWDMAFSIQPASDGGCIVAGYTDSFGAGESDVYILKLDSEGKIVRAKMYGGIYDDEAWSIQQTSDGGYIVAGYTNSFGAGGSDVYVLKLDSDGNL